MSSITIIVYDLGKFAVKVENMAHNQDKIQRAVNKSGLSIERQAKSNLTANGSVKTGHLRRYTVAKFGKLEATVHTSNIKYAPWVEKGTGAHTIRPKRKKALYWAGASHPVRSVRHTGSAAKPFLIPAFEQEKPKFLQNLKEAIKWN